jgi:hypothetical protein
MVIPRDTEMPWMEMVMRLLAFAKFVANQIQQSLQGFLCAVTLSIDLYGASYPCGEHHDAHDGFGIHSALAFGYEDFAGVAARQFGQLR